MTSGRSDLVDIEADLIHETDKAYLLSNGERQVWVPKSVVQNNEDGTWTMPERLAVDKGLV